MVELAYNEISLLFEQISKQSVEVVCFLLIVYDKMQEREMN
jgi:hypothetical protein